MSSKLEEMDLQARKISFVQEFLRLQNEDTIQGLEDFLKKHKSELFEQHLSPMSDDLNKQIDESMLDSKQNKVKKASDLKAKYGAF